MQPVKQSRGPYASEADGFNSYTPRVDVNDCYMQWMFRGCRDKYARYTVGFFLSKVDNRSTWLYVKLALMIFPQLRKIAKARTYIIGNCINDELNT